MGASVPSIDRRWAQRLRRQATGTDGSRAQGAGSGGQECAAHKTTGESVKSYIAKFICKFRGHQWGRTKRASETSIDVTTFDSSAKVYELGLTSEGTRTCKRCGLVQVVVMKTPYTRKRRAAEAKEAANRG